MGQMLGSVPCLSHDWHRPGIPAQALLIPSWVPSWALAASGKPSKVPDLGNAHPALGQSLSSSSTPQNSPAIEVSEITGQPLFNSMNNYPQVHRERTSPCKVPTCPPGRVHFLLCHVPLVSGRTSSWSLYCALPHVIPEAMQLLKAWCLGSRENSGSATYWLRGLELLNCLSTCIQ